MRFVAPKRLGSNGTAGIGLALGAWPRPVGVGFTWSRCLRELSAIARHPIKTHSILIDDVRLFLTHNFGDISLGDVAEALWAINPEYVLERVDGYVPMDILTASL